MMNPVRVAISQLAPGYFAAVMGTGIVSIGLHDLGIHPLSVALMWITCALYVTLWALYLWRAVAFRAEVIADLRDPEKAFGYFTVVAASSVLGVRLAREGLVSPAIPLFVLAGVIWVVFGYLLPWQVLMTRDGRPIISRANGSWFVWAVASQSLAISMAQLHPAPGSATAIWVGVLAVLAWAVGVALYAALAMLVLLRVVLHGITPEQFDPAYWVSMGALAIAVVAGAGIVGMPPTPIVDAVRPLIAATVVIFWAFCLWLIPLLIGAGVWRHGVHRVPLRYVPTLWSMVFPIGMFAVASESLASADRLPAAAEVGRVALVIAVIVWALVFGGMLQQAARTVWPSARRMRIRRAAPSA